MADKFIGIQLGCHSVFDEGADQCLDIMQKTAGVNAVFVYSHGDDRFAFMRPKEGIAPDHPTPVKDPQTRKLTTLWFHPHEKYYKGTVLRHQAMPDREYDGRDVFEELIEPCRKRNIKLFARALEAYAEHTVPLVDNWTKVLSVDVFGRIDHRPCFQNPDYRNFWLATVEDLFKSYPLDGFKYGAERSGPLANLIIDGVAPSCFCDYCCERARAEGINVERAKRGYRELHAFIQSCLHDDPPPSDGYHVTFVRILLKYPEILAWEYMWHQQKEDLSRRMYGAIKTIKPQAKVGWHVYHSVTWQTIYRAEMNYAELADYSDWLKPVVYHDIAGVRIRKRHIAQLKRTILREISEEDSLSLLYDFMGYDHRCVGLLHALENLLGLYEAARKRLLLARSKDRSA